MQYIVGANQVIALALPEHRKWEDSDEGKVWNHVSTDKAIVMYNAPVDMKFLRGTITQILNESKSVEEIVRDLTVLNSIQLVSIHAMLLNYSDQNRGRAQDDKDIWYRYYEVQHYKKDDKGRLSRYTNEFSHDHLYDFDMTYGIPQYMVDYLGRRTYEARRNQPGENQANHQESLDWARTIIRRECMDHMLNPHFHELTIAVPEYEEIYTDKGMKPAGFKDLYKR